MTSYVPNETSFDALQRTSPQRPVGCSDTLTGNPAGAQYIVHEACSCAWQQRPEGEANGNPETWVLAMVWRVAVSQWSRTRSRLVANQRVGEPPPLPEPISDRLTLAAACARIPVAQRTAIVLHHLLGLLVAAGVTKTGVPQSTIKARPSRGWQALAEQLRESEDAHV